MNSPLLQILPNLNRVRIAAALFLLQFAFVSNVFSGCIFGGQILAEELEVGNLITWMTVSEQDNNKFIIQKSHDGFEFEDFGYIKGAGNSTVVNRYSYLDPKIGNRKTYYRLVQEDFDGSRVHAHTILVDRKVANNFIVTGVNTTVTDKTFTIAAKSVVEGLMTVNIAGPGGEFDMNWMILKGDNSLEIDLENASLGTYEIELVMEEEMETLFIKKVAPSEAPNLDFIIKE